MPIFKNFLQKLIGNLSPDVFKPIPQGILYVFLQAIAREIYGECPWDTGEECQRGYTYQYWSRRCRNILCPGYRHPWGLIGYTSESWDQSSIDNRFNYNSFRYKAGNRDDRIPIGTLGAWMIFDFGLIFDPGGYGAGFYGAGEYGYNAVIPTGEGVVIGDKWYIICHTASTVIGTDGKTYQCKLRHEALANTRPITGADWEDYWVEGGLAGDTWQFSIPARRVFYDVNGIVGPAIPDAGNKGIYGPVTTGGTYRGEHDTIYTVTIIRFDAYEQNFENAILQISLATCTDEWLDYWGDYFGLPRLLGVKGGVGYETDEAYRARIMKEITKAKGTRPAIWEEAKDYFESDRVTVEEYHQYGSQSVVVGIGSDGKPNGKYYKCIQQHISTPANQPITGVDWEDYWIEGGLAGNTWIEGTEYVTGWYPRWDGPVKSQYPYPGCPAYEKNDPARGLWPFEFYINIPTQRSPSAKFVKEGDNLSGDDVAYVYEAGYGYYYGYGSFHPISPHSKIFSDPVNIGDSFLIGNEFQFSGVHFKWDVPGVFGDYAWEYWNGIQWLPLIYRDQNFSPVPPIIDYATVPVWKASHNYYRFFDLVEGYLTHFEIEDIVKPTVPNGYVYIASTGGFSGGIEPIWPTTIGDTVLDGDILWVCDSLIAEENVTLLRQDGWIHWIEHLTDWIQADNVPYNIPNTGTPLYWIRCRVISVPTVCPIVDDFYLTYAGQTCRGSYCAKGIKSCKCDQKCYDYVQCTCDTTCYGYFCACDQMCYGGYVDCTCNYSCDDNVRHCNCDYTGYGYTPCSACDYGDYGLVWCTTCDMGCYTETGQIGCNCYTSCYGELR